MFLAMAFKDQTIKVSWRHNVESVMKKLQDNDYLKALIW